MKKTLIYIERDYWRDALDLLDAGEQIFQGTDHLCYGVSVNLDNPEALEGIQGCFDFFIPLRDSRIAQYDSVNIAAFLEELHQEYAFDCILIIASPFGRTLAPRLAMKINAPLCADVTMIDHHKGEPLLVRPAFDGKMLAAISCLGKGPVMASIRTGTFTHRGRRDKAGTVLERPLRNFKPCGLKLIDTRKKEEFQDIRKNPVLVSAGAGVGSSFKQIEGLAQALQGMTASSRKLVDQGIAPRSIQVGQSGKTVSPKLYIALGINGAMQHLEGMKRAEYLIAVNTNKDAPLCSLSDIVVEGDAVEFAQKLAAKLRGRK